MKKTIKMLALCGACFCCSCQKKQTTKKTSAQALTTKKLSSKMKTKLLQKSAKPSPNPALGNTVLVHYTGWIAQEDKTPGRQIDSSLERNKPLQFTIGLKQVIKGFEEGVMQMQVGEKRRLFIPADLGYGPRGVGLFIPPNSDLIFDVELLAMK